VAEYYQGAGQTITEDLSAVSGLRAVPTKQTALADFHANGDAVPALQVSTPRRLRDGKILFQAGGAGRHSGPDRESMRLNSEHFSD
jgi:hypothetical protein